MQANTWSFRKQRSLCHSQEMYLSALCPTWRLVNDGWGFATSSSTHQNPLVPMNYGCVLSRKWRSFSRRNITTRKANSAPRHCNENSLKSYIVALTNKCYIANFGQCTLHALLVNKQSFRKCKKPLPRLENTYFGMSTNPAFS